MAQERRDLARHLLHFTRGVDWRAGRIPVFVRGEGCHIWDESGQRYLDGLAGLFVVQIGHGRSDIAHAAAKQMEVLAYTPSWSATHPAALETAALIAGLAPSGLETVFFVSSGSEAVESAIKFARQYHRARGNPTKTGVISRQLSYHGTTMGALSATGLDAIREPFEPLLPGFVRVANTLGHDDGVEAAAAVEEAILQAGPDHVGLVVAEPVQNGGGAIVPPPGYWAELRRICDEHDVLLLADEVINSFGRLGTWFGSELVGGTPDLISFAKGATSGYAPVGGLIMRTSVVDELMDSENGTFTHGATWGGHPVSMAAASANIAALRDEQVLDNVREHEPYFAARLNELHDAFDVVSEIRGIGYFYAVELCASRRDGRFFSPATTKELLGEVLPGLIRDAHLLIRADDRGTLKLMLSPPLVAERTEIDELITGVGQILERLSARFPE